MKQLISLGIIAEYNPFHSGHAYHVECSRKLTGADCVIVVMSGDFLQRGEPAIVDKYTRAEMALYNGADLVIELPVVSACSSAPYFARGSIAILNALDVNHLSFGSESGDIAPLQELIHFLSDNETILDTAIKELTATGLSYPFARNKAVNALTGTRYDQILKKPNNILGIEYLMELKRTGSSIVPHTIMRLGNDYNDTDLSDSLSSASSIRKRIHDGNNLPASALPENVSKILDRYQKEHRFVRLDDFTLLLKMKILEIKKEKSGSAIADLPDYLIHKLIQETEHCNTVTELIVAVKSKDLTYARISRALTHILLNITESDYRKFQANPCPYIRVLGLNDTGAAFLSTRKKNLSCPLIIKPADYREYLAQDIFAADVYNMVANSHSTLKIPNDYQHKIIKL